MSTTRPLLTQREAATACGVSRTTIRRRREAGELPGSVLDDERGWLIPVDDLLAAGFRLHAPAPADKAGTNEATAGAGQPDGHGQAAELRAELERLRHETELQLAQEQHARALAETEPRHLKERLAERAGHIADLQRALAALTPAPERAAIPQPTAPAVPAPAPAVAPAASETAAAGHNHHQEQGERRRWWSAAADHRAHPARRQHLLRHLLHDLLRLPLRHLLREPSGALRVAAGHRALLAWSGV
ncbi:helix-turn-helix transcriptional regulator [Streptomyces cellulosae]|uniref:helix-turn-helix transcriptional regulator n=1 Tax=Streptomyces cellulosae TaxID=1968 RepID=UPI0004C83FA4|nr:helix-turn-helix domain-containing protein [Streptomyces cellulosae]